MIYRKHTVQLVREARFSSGRPPLCWGIHGVHDASGHLVRQRVAAFRTRGEAPSLTRGDGRGRDLWTDPGCSRERTGCTSPQSSGATRPRRKKRASGSCGRPRPSCGRSGAPHSGAPQRAQMTDGVSEALTDSLRRLRDITSSAPLRQSVRALPLRGLPAFALLSMAGSVGEFLFARKREFSVREIPAFMKTRSSLFSLS
jgi:hypothetical protein